MAYDSGGKYYNDIPLTHCKICGNKLELSNEFDTCSECQKGRKTYKVETELKDNQDETTHITRKYKEDNKGE